MASLKITGMEELEMQLSRLAGDSDRVARAALEAAAVPVVERVRKNIENLREDWQPNPQDKYRYLSEGQSFDGIPPHQKEDLLRALGVSKVSVDEHGDWTVRIGFNSSGPKGYGDQPTATYPRGQPIPMIARSVESGTSIQPKQPFMRPAVDATKKKAVEVMDDVISREVAKIVK